MVYISNFNLSLLNNLQTMETTFHAANSRGYANHGWLEARHSFSFASWYNPDKIHFGVLRVLNDDLVAGKMGFNTHPHDNMEIITIPLKGELSHKDSMGNASTITAGEIQVMSAGTGIQHSEFNTGKDTLNLLQIWVFPNKRNVTPRYDQQLLDVNAMNNAFAQVLSPNPDDAGVWIHQDAWFHLGKFTEASKQSYTIKRKGNGAYIFVIEGSVRVGDQLLNKRDALGVWDTEQLDLHVESNSHVLIMDIPMDLVQQ